MSRNSLNIASVSALPGIIVSAWPSYRTELCFSVMVPSLRDMMAFIGENYGGKILLEDSARSGNVCKSGCNNIFRRYLHTTPIGYLMDYRLQQARKLLLSTDMKVTEVSFETGFPSVSYFISLYKKAYGCSPSRTRAENGL